MADLLDHVCDLLSARLLRRRNLSHHAPVLAPEIGFPPLSGPASNPWRAQSLCQICGPGIRCAEW